MRVFGMMCGLTMGLVTMSGCSQARLSSVDPSVRSFYEDADIDKSYIGFDLSFVVEHDEPHVPRAGQIVDR